MVRPGVVRTNFLQTGSGMTADGASQFYENFGKSSGLLGGVGDVSDIVSAVEWLSDSSKTPWVTGTIITVDGGLIVTP